MEWPFQIGDRRDPVIIVTIFVIYSNTEIHMNKSLKEMLRLRTEGTTQIIARCLQ